MHSIDEPDDYPRLDGGREISAAHLAPEREGAKRHQTPSPESREPQERLVREVHATMGGAVLEAIDSHNIVLALAGSLGNSKRTVREVAVEVLTEMGSKAAPAIPALTKAMDPKGTYLSMLAGSAFQAIRTPEALAEVKKRDTTSGSADSNKDGDTTDMFQ